MISKGTILLLMIGSSYAAYCHISLPENLWPNHLKLNQGSVVQMDRTLWAKPGKRIRLECTRGYNLHPHVPVVTCDDRNWPDTLPMCYGKVKHKLYDVKYPVLSEDTGSLIWMLLTLRLLSNFLDNDSPSTEGPVTCVGISAPTNGKSTCENGFLSTDPPCMITCDEDYYLTQGEASVECSDNNGVGTLSSTETHECSSVTCAGIPAPTNGKSTCENGFLFTDPPCSITCDCGDLTQGEASVDCFDNNGVGTLSSTETHICPLGSDVIFIIDQSYSINSAETAIMRNFLNVVAAGLSNYPNRHIGVIDFSNQPNTRLPLTVFPDAASLQSAFTAMTLAVDGSGSAISPAIRAGLAALQASPNFLNSCNKRKMVVVTDHQSHQAHTLTADNNLLVANNIDVIFLLQTSSTEDVFPQLVKKLGINRPDWNDLLSPAVVSQVVGELND